MKQERTSYDKDSPMSKSKISKIESQAGNGEWTPGANGHTRFIEAAKDHAKSSAARYKEKGLDRIADIFSKRALELEEEIRIEKEKFS